MPVYYPYSPIQSGNEIAFTAASTSLIATTKLLLLVVVKSAKDPIAYELIPTLSILALRLVCNFFTASVIVAAPVNIVSY